MANNYNTWGGKNNSWGNRNRKGQTPSGGGRRSSNNQEPNKLVYLVIQM